MPLATTHPKEELDYVITDSGASIVLTDAAFGEISSKVAKQAERPLLTVASEYNTSAGKREWSSDRLPPVVDADGASILYTSGTTARPKGVLATHRAVTAQVKLRTVHP